jgi:hypothetical protein
MRARPRTKAAKKRRVRVKSERKLKKKYPHYHLMGGRAR